MTVGYNGDVGLDESAEKLSPGVLVCRDDNFVLPSLSFAVPSDCTKLPRGGVKAPVIMELTGDEDVTGVCGVIGDRSADISRPLLVLMECDGDFGSIRLEICNSLFFLLEECPLPEEETEDRSRFRGDTVTDSKILEWASLGVNRGARSSGLLL